MAKLLELESADVNAPQGKDKEKASGRLVRHDGERAAMQYKPVRTPGGDFLIVASQSAQNNAEVSAIGSYHGTGKSQWHRSRRAAQQDLYTRRKRDRDPQAGRSFFTEVTHVDPTDARRSAAKRQREKSRDRAASAASGRLYRRQDGEHAAKRYMPVWNGKNFLIIGFQGDENRQEVRKHGDFAGNLSGPRSFPDHSSAKKSLYERLVQEGDPQARRAYFTYVVHVDPTGTAALSPRRETPSGRVPSSQRELSALGERRGEDFSIRLRRKAGDLQGLSSSSLRKVLASDAEREARAQADREGLRGEGARAFIASFVGTAVSRAQSAPSGALSSGSKVGLAIAGAGVVVVGATAAVHAWMKSSAARPA